MSRWMPELRPAHCWLGHEAPAVAFDAWCAAHAGRAAIVWLGGGLLAPLLVPPDRPLAGDAALRDYLRRVLVHYGVPPGAALATWRSGVRLGGVALAGAAPSELRAVAGRHRVRLRGLRPGWALALDDAWRRGALPRRGPARLRIDEPGCCTRLTLDDGALVALDLHWDEPPIADGERRWSPDARLAEATRAGSLVRWAPDFLAAPAASPRAGWALAACGVATLAVALLDARAPETVPEVAAVVTDAPVVAADTAQDWREVFAAAEQASVPGLQWLRLEHERARGALRLAGAAPDVAPALAAADRLAARAGWQQALLAQTEPDPQGGLRFELQAQRIGSGSRR